MRRAFELGHATAYLFAGTRPSFEQVGAPLCNKVPPLDCVGEHRPPPPCSALQVEHVSFRAPVDVGSLLSLRAAVVLVQRDAAPRPLVTVDVEAVIVRPEQATSATSNTFTFTFSLDPEALALSQGGALKRVLPQNGEEAQRQIEVLQLLQDD